MTKLFGRDQVAWLALVTGIVQVFLAFGVDLTSTVQVWVTAAIVFVFAVINAIKVHDGAVALVSGVVLALFNLLAAFGLHWTSDHKQALLAALAVVVGFFVRSQVTNPIPASVSPAGKLVAPVAEAPPAA
jgi:hypothetical protein